MIKVKTLSDIDEEYGVTEKTFRKILKEKEIPYRHGLNFGDDQKRIYERLGYPPGVDKEAYKGIEILFVS